MARTAAAALWAGLLAILGLMVLLDRGGPLRVPSPLGWCVGAGALAGAQFVLMVLVADRWFPKASRGLVMVLEALAFLVFLGGVVLAVFVLQAGAGA